MSEKNVYAFIEYDGMSKFRGIRDTISASSFDEARKKSGEDKEVSYVAGGYSDNPVYRYNRTKLEGPYDKHIIDAASAMSVHPNEIDEDEVVRYQSHRIYSKCFDISKDNFNEDKQDQVKEQIIDLFQDIQSISNIDSNTQNEIIVNGLTNVLTDYYTFVFDDNRKSSRNQELAEKFVQSIICAIPDEDHILEALQDMVKQDFESMKKYQEKIPNDFDKEEYEFFEVRGAHFDETDKKILETLDNEIHARKESLSPR